MARSGGVWKIGLSHFRLESWGGQGQYTAMEQRTTDLRLPALPLKSLIFMAFLTVGATSNSIYAQVKQPVGSDSISAPSSVQLHGQYYFYTAAKINGHPVCSERWTINDDGTITVFSGQEIVREKFRIEDNGHKDEAVIISQLISTNGQPDCVQRISKLEDSHEKRTMLYRAKAGNFVLFNESFFNNGQRLISPYALLYPSALVDNPSTAPR